LESLAEISVGALVARDAEVMAPADARDAEVVASADSRDVEVVASAVSRDAELEASTCCDHPGAVATHREMMIAPRSQGRPQEIRPNAM